VAHGSSHCNSPSQCVDAATAVAAQGQTYRLQLQLKEGSALEDGTAMVCDDSGRREAIAFEGRDGSSKELVGVWKCERAACARGARSVMTLSLPIVDFGEAWFNFLAKVYPASEARHAASGTRLRSVILEFKRTGADVKLNRQQWIAE
jgi:hypothetical protein